MGSRSSKCRSCSSTAASVLRRCRARSSSKRSPSSGRSVYASRRAVADPSPPAAPVPSAAAAALDDADRVVARWLGILLFVSYGYFVAAPSWNDTSRFDLTRALVERRALDIDPDHRNTGDKAFRDGHYYTD